MTGLTGALLYISAQLAIPFRPEENLQNPAWKPGVCQMSLGDRIWCNTEVTAVVRIPYQRM